MNEKFGRNDSKGRNNAFILNAFFLRIGYLQFYMIDSYFSKKSESILKKRHRVDWNILKNVPLPFFSYLIILTCIIV